MTQRKAFTLIELLVVVSIIALLVSILLPALGKAREQAQSGVCKQNLHTLGVSEMLYTTEHNGKIAWSRYDQGGLTMYWAAQLWAAYNRIDLPTGWGDTREAITAPDWLMCPSEKRQKPGTTWGDVPRGVGPWLQNICYTRNAFGWKVGHYQPSANISRPQGSYERIARPATVANITDGCYIWWTGLSSWCELTDSSGNYHPTFAEGGSRATSYRHSGNQGINVLLWDGHVEAVIHSIMKNFEVNAF